MPGAVREHVPLREGTPEAMPALVARNVDEIHPDVFAEQVRRVIEALKDVAPAAHSVVRAHRPLMELLSGEDREEADDRLDRIDGEPLE